MLWNRPLLSVIKCRYCDKSDEVRLHGKGRSGYQRYRCLACKRTFQAKYIYNVGKQERSLSELDR